MLLNRLIIISSFTLVAALPFTTLSDVGPVQVNPESVALNATSNQSAGFDVAENTDTAHDSNNTIEASRFYGISRYVFWDEEFFHYHNERVDDHCNTYSSVFVPYTGFRVFHQIKFKMGIEHSTHLVYCYRGRVTAHTSVINRIDQNVNYKDTMCIRESEPLAPNANGCYRIARRSTTPSMIPWLRSESFIGGLFRCPTNDENGPCNNDDAVPVAPLIGDEPYMGINDIHSPLSYAMRIPVAYTPDYFNYMYPRDSDKWARFIDINEDYIRPIRNDQWDDNYDYFPGVIDYDPYVGAQNTTFSGPNSIVTSAFGNKDFHYKMKQVYFLIKNSLPITDPFHKEPVNTKDLSEFLSTHGMKALVLMKNKTKAQQVYDTIVNLFNPPVREMKTYTIKEWKEMIAMKM